MQVVTAGEHISLHLMKYKWVKPDTPRKSSLRYRHQELSKKAYWNYITELEVMELGILDKYSEPKRHLQRKALKGTITPNEMTILLGWESEKDVQGY